MRPTIKTSIKIDRKICWRVRNSLIERKASQNTQNRGFKYIFPVWMPPVSNFIEGRPFIWTIYSTVILILPLYTAYKILQNFYYWSCWNCLRYILKFILFCLFFDHHQVLLLLCLTYETTLNWKSLWTVESKMPFLYSWTHATTTNWPTSIGSPVIKTCNELIVTGIASHWVLRAVVKEDENSLLQRRAVRIWDNHFASDIINHHHAGWAQIVN